MRNFTALMEETIETASPVGLSELYDKIQRCEAFLLVMAMDQRRFEKAHIDGSLSFDSLQAQLDTLPKDTDIVVYCTGPDCAASKLRAAMLVEAGFTNVSRFAGGLAEWAAAGLPISGELGDAV